MVRLKVHFRDIWCAGKHIIACGDVNQEHILQLYAFISRPIVMAYTDPPWGTRIYKFFWKRAGFSADPPEYLTFLRNLIRSLQIVTGDCYVEMGRQWADLLHDSLKRLGMQICDLWEIRYGPGRPAYLFRARNQGITKGTSLSFQHKHDNHTPELAILQSSELEEYVLDPCVGEGLTARTCHKLNRVCIAMDLNADKCEKTLNLLSRLGAEPLEKIGHLG